MCVGVDEWRCWCGGECVSQIRFVKMSVDLWMMRNVAIHLCQGYGGQDVKVLPMPIINVEWERVVGVVFRCKCRADIYSFLSTTTAILYINL